MKPAPFDYFAPRTVDEAVDVLRKHGSDAAVLAGGQSLVRLMNTRVQTPKVIVDINRIGELDRIAATDGVVTIGATTRQRTSEQSALVRAELPLLAEAGALVADITVRQRGTVVGSVAFADPAAELPAALLALDGEVVAASSAGERVIAADDFYTGPFQTSRRPDELVTELRIPSRTGTRIGTAFVEFARRHGDTPVGGVGSVIELDGSGVIRWARIALCSLSTQPVRAKQAETALIGTRGEADELTGAAEQASREIQPVADHNGDVHYRLALARVLTRRSLEQAVRRGQEGGAYA